jgi:hypothetical protein
MVIGSQYLKRKEASVRSLARADSFPVLHSLLPAGHETWVPVSGHVQFLLSKEYTQQRWYSWPHGNRVNTTPSTRRSQQTPQVLVQFRLFSLSHGKIRALGSLTMAAGDAAMSEVSVHVGAIAFSMASAIGDEMPIESCREFTRSRYDFEQGDDLVLDAHPIDMERMEQHRPWLGGTRPTGGSLDSLIRNNFL